MIVSVSSWVIANKSDPRYLLPSCILAASVCGSAFVHLAKRYCAQDGVVLLMSFCFLLVAIARPAPSSPAGIIEPAKRPLVDAVASLAVARSLDGIEGDYWDVWPSVFEAEQMRHDAGSPVGRIFGLTYRGEAREQAFAARLLERGRLDILCIDPSPGHCNALTLVTMRPPATEMKVTAPAIRLRDGTLLNFLTIKIIRHGSG